MEIDSMLLILSNKINQIQCSYRLLEKENKKLSKAFFNPKKVKSKSKESLTANKFDEQSDTFKNYFNECVKSCEEFKNYACEVYRKINNSKTELCSVGSNDSDECKRSNPSLFCLR
jgi:hypothetical protein